MVVSIKDLLDHIARRNGHANWDLAVHRLDQKSLHNLYLIAIKESTGRGFNEGWKERSRRVSYPKNKLDECKTKAYNSAQQKLDELQLTNSKEEVV